MVKVESGCKLVVSGQNLSASPTPFSLLCIHTYACAREKYLLFRFRNITKSFLLCVDPSLLSATTTPSVPANSSVCFCDLFPPPPTPTPSAQNRHFQPAPTTQRTHPFHPSLSQTMMTPAQFWISDWYCSYWLIFLLRMSSTFPSIRVKAALSMHTTLTAPFALHVAFLGALLSSASSPK